MADITVTAAQVGLMRTVDNEVYSFIANAAITAGQAVYLIPSSTGAGKVAPADGSAAGTANTLIGVAIHAAAAGRAVDVVKRGLLQGFTFTQDYFAPIYLSDTDSGVLADAAGTVSKIVGRVVPVPTDSGLSKALYVQVDWN